jgi:hypothetical protein
MKTYTIKVKKPFVCKTHGNGYWSNEELKTTVKKINFEVAYFSEDSVTLYVEVFFSQREWNIETDGLIYTDTNWIKDFSKNFVKLPEVKNLVKMKDIDYTEQGMQGDNYVSLSFSIKGEKNMKEFFKRIGSELNTKVIYQVAGDEEEYGN